jgi:hypothetical protein
MPGKKAAKAKPKTTRPAAKKAARKPAKKAAAKAGASGDWQGRLLSRLRALIHQADPDIVEEVKWRKPSNPAGVPVWSHDGMVCTGETYRDHVRLTFFKGSELEDPAGLFEPAPGLRRALKLHQGEPVDEEAFQALIREAVRLNTA